MEVSTLEWRRCPLLYRGNFLDEGDLVDSVGHLASFCLASRWAKTFLKRVLYGELVDKPFQVSDLGLVVLTVIVKSLFPLLSKTLTPPIDQVRMNLMLTGSLSQRFAGLNFMKHMQLEFSRVLLFETHTGSSPKGKIPS